MQNIQSFICQENEESSQTLSHPHLCNSNSIEEKKTFLTNWSKMQNHRGPVWYF